MIGTVLSGRYRLDSKLGSGGMSTVYLAIDETLERPVAVKVLHAEISDQPDQIERFRREARSVAKLSHPNVVAVIDARRKGPGWEVYVDGGRLPTGLDAVEWAVRGVELGAGEILLTSMDADGTLAGYDIELTRTISERVSVPVIASGGAGTPAHFAEVLTRGKADAALAASLFHDGKLRISELKEQLHEWNIPIRAALEV